MEPVIAGEAMATFSVMIADIIADGDSDGRYIVVAGGSLTYTHGN